MREEKMYKKEERKKELKKGRKSMNKIGWIEGIREKKISRGRKEQEMEEK
jgi:hypothetical protein